jgi:hypothetical protein
MLDQSGCCMQMGTTAVMWTWRPAHVGCCDDSPNRHATKNFHATTHPIIEGYDPPASANASSESNGLTTIKIPFDIAESQRRIRVPAAAFNQDADKTMKQLSDSGFDAERLGDKILNFVRGRTL